MHDVHDAFLITLRISKIIEQLYILTIHHSLCVRAVFIRRHLMTSYQWLLILRDLLQRWFSWGQKVLGALSCIFMLLLLITCSGAQKGLDKVRDYFRGFASKRIGYGEERVGQSAQRWSPQETQIGWLHATKNVNWLPVKRERKRRNVKWCKQINEIYQLFRPWSFIEAPQERNQIV